MTTSEQIQDLMASQPDGKRADMHTLHDLILQAMPKTKLWFDTGVDQTGKVVTNPTIGYGQQTLKYANGSTKEFFQVGLCANKNGFSVYILGIPDKKYLTDTYGAKIGKASVTGYCIRFKAVKDIDSAVLLAAIRDGVSRTAG